MAAARGQKAVDGGYQAAEQGAGGKEADGCSLGMDVPFSEVAEQLRFAIKEIYVYQMPPNGFICKAAIGSLQRSKHPAIGIPNKKAAGIRRPLYSRLQAAYSAACFRGGSSAPESWISAT
jgi:hypothetical protein